MPPERHLHVYALAAAVVPEQYPQQLRHDLATPVRGATIRLFLNHLHRIESSPPENASDWHETSRLREAPCTLSSPFGWICLSGATTILSG